jgi:3-oxoacyl-[acyl-carrier-protein] synthase II
MHRVMITGIGVICPTGVGRDAFWSNLITGRSGIGPISLFDASSFPVRIAGEVKELNTAAIREEYPQAVNTRDRKVLLALNAAEEAVGDAGLAKHDLENAALCYGVGLEAFFLEDLTPCVHRPDFAHALVDFILRDNPHRNMQTPLDCASRILGERFGFRAGRYTNCSACAAGAQAIGEAWQILREGTASVVLAGAADSMINPLGVGGFSLLKVLSEENDHPLKACRPFDATRKGTVLGEGSAMLVLETLEHAQSRSARIYAELLGYGSSLDAFRVSDPDPEGRGAVRSMKKAIAAAGLRPEDIDCVNAHGTGTPKNDRVETMAIKEALGDRARQIPVHAVKSMTGHLIAASGAVEAVAAAQTIHGRKVPPTINLEHADPECDLDYVASKARDFQGDTILSNSFGFGGQNATLIFGRCEG